MGHMGERLGLLSNPFAPSYHLVINPTSAAPALPLAMGGIPPLLANGLYPTDVVFGRKSACGILKHHQRANDSEDETSEYPQQRHMHRILAALQAVTGPDSRALANLRRLSQVRARTSYRFEEASQYRYAVAKTSRVNHYGGAGFDFAPHRRIAG